MRRPRQLRHGALQTAHRKASQRRVSVVSVTRYKQQVGAEPQSLVARFSKGYYRKNKTKPKTKMAVAVSKTSIIKILELILTCVCLGLQYHSFAINDLHEIMITCGTFGGYLIILVGTLAGSCTGQPISKRVDIFFSLVGCALFVAAGVLSIRYFQNVTFSYKETKDIGIAKGSLAIVNGALFLLDAIFSFRGE